MLSVTCEKYIGEEAAHLFDAYKNAYHQVSEQLHKPNVLITGITGSGKSSFINALFHSDIAPTGSGTPITQHFTRYEPEELPIVLYDSKGLENGRADEFIGSTQEFFRLHHAGGIKDSVHVVWYIVNSAMARFQDFEKHICRSLFHDVPIIFMLNKADISTEEEKREVRKEIAQLQLENCYGIFNTISASDSQQCRDIEICPKCNSEYIVIKQKTKMMHCSDCNYSTSILVNNGLSSVIKATLNLLPTLAKDAFVAAQKVSVHAIEEQAGEIIRTYAGQFDDIQSKRTLLHQSAEMLTRLSKIWKFREHGKMYGVNVAKRMVEALSFRDSVMLFLHKNKHQQNRAVALGVLWNHCLRVLAIELFRDTVHIDDIDVAALKEHWLDLIHKAFEVLSDEGLCEYEALIEAKGLATVLEMEMPVEDEDLDITPLSPFVDHIDTECSHSEHKVQSANQEYKTNQPHKTHQHKRSKSHSKKHHSHIRSSGHGKTKTGHKKRKTTHSSKSDEDKPSSKSSDHLKSPKLSVRKSSGNLKHHRNPKTKRRGSGRGSGRKRVVSHSGSFVTNVKRRLSHVKV